MRHGVFLTFFMQKNTVRENRDGVSFYQLFTVHYSALFIFFLSTGIQRPA